MTKITSPVIHLECKPTGRITYHQLAQLITQMSDEQKDMDVTIEEPYPQGDVECFAGELAICGPDHLSLDDYHPVIRYLD